MKVDDLIRIATAEIGTKEDPMNSNKTKYGQWFELNGFPWCGMFVSWCYWKAAIYLPTIGFVKPGFASCQLAVSYFKQHKAITAKPIEGDLVFFDWNNDGRYDHVGIFIQKIDKDHFYTIEGNTSKGNDSNGGQVMKRIRQFGKAIFVHIETTF